MSTSGVVSIPPWRKVTELWFSEWESRYWAWQHLTLDRGACSECCVYNKKEDLLCRPLFSSGFLLNHRETLFWTSFDIFWLDIILCPRDARHTGESRGVISHKSRDICDNHWSSVTWERQPPGKLQRHFRVTESRDKDVTLPQDSS